jgi:hypothetical protein
MVFDRFARTSYVDSLLLWQTCHLQELNKIQCYVSYYVLHHTVFSLGRFAQVLPASLRSLTVCTGSADSGTNSSNIVSSKSSTTATAACHLLTSRADTECLVQRCPELESLVLRGNSNSSTTAAAAVYDADWSNMSVTANAEHITAPAPAAATDTQRNSDTDEPNSIPTSSVLLTSAPRGSPVIMRGRGSSAGALDHSAARSLLQMGAVPLLQLSQLQVLEVTDVQLLPPLAVLLALQRAVTGGAGPQQLQALKLVSNGLRYV